MPNYTLFSLSKNGFQQNTELSSQTMTSKRFNWNRYIAPQDWLDKFVDYLAVKANDLGFSWNKQQIKKELQRHLNEDSTNDQSSLDKIRMLRTKLQRIEAVVNRHVDPAICYNPAQDDSQIVSSLLEALPNCSNGVSERAHILWEVFTTPRSLMGLLGAMRREIVDAFARRKTENLTSMQIHEYDVYFIAAEKAGLGVSGAKSRTKEASLKHINEIVTEFKQSYTPLLILEYLENIIQTQLQDIGMSLNPQELPIETVEIYVNTINERLNTQGCLYDFFNVENGYHIQSLDWGKIRNFIVKTLHKKEIFKSNITDKIDDDTQYKDYLFPDPFNIREVHYWVSISTALQIENFLNFLSADESLLFYFYATFFKSNNEESVKQFFALKKNEFLEIYQNMLVVGLTPPFQIFLYACKKGNLELVDWILQHTVTDADVLEKLLFFKGSEVGAKTALQLACIEGHAAIVKSILDTVGNHPHTCRKLLLDGSSSEGLALAFRFACGKGHLEVVQKMLGAVTDLETLNTILLAGFPEEGSADALRFASHNGHHEVVKEILNVADDKTLKAMLLAGNLETGPARAFRLACQSNHTKTVKEILSAVKDPETMKTILFAARDGEAPANGFRWACQHLNIEMVREILSAAKASETLRSLLLLGAPRKGPAVVFRWACRNGHHELVREILKSADSETQNTMVLSGVPEEGYAEGFRLACQNGHDEVVREIFSVVKDPVILNTLLLSGVPGNGSAIGFIVASENGHTKVVKEILSRAKNTEALRKMLLAEIPGHHSPKAFQLACKNGHIEIITAQIISALTLNDMGIISQFFSLLNSGVRSKLIENLIKNDEFIQGLLQGDAARKKVLTYLNKHMTTSQKKYLLSKINMADLSLNITHLKTTYAAHAGFFSLTRMRMNKCNTQKELIEQLQERATKNLCGASMETLLRAASGKC